MAPEILGLYKLSATTINRCIRRTITDKYGNKVPGCSKNEIAALIYMSHIADQSGAIENITAAQLQKAIQCSRRDSFLILKNLETKGFINIENRYWTGYMDVTILDNDFSKITKYTKDTKYLNTNRGFFDRTNEDFYKRFRNLSLYATRLLLHLLLCYNVDYGYTITYTSLAAVIDIKNRSLVHKYMEELNEILGAFCDSSFYESFKDERKGYLYGRIKIYFHNNMMMPEQGIDEKQDSYYKRFWISKFNDGTYIVDGYRTSYEGFASQLYQIASHYITQFNKTRTFVENVIHTQLQYYGVVSERTLYHINEKLENLCRPV